MAFTVKLLPVSASPLFRAADVVLPAVPTSLRQLRPLLGGFEQASKNVAVLLTQGASPALIDAQAAELGQLRLTLAEPLRSLPLTPRPSWEALATSFGKLGSDIRRAANEPKQQTTLPVDDLAAEIYRQQPASPEAVAQALLTAANEPGNRHAKTAPWNSPLVAEPGDDSIESVFARQARALERAVRLSEAPFAFQLELNGRLQAAPVPAAKPRSAAAFLAAVKRSKEVDRLSAAVLEAKTPAEAAAFVRWARDHLAELGYRPDSAPGLLSNLKYLANKNGVPQLWADALRTAEAQGSSAKILPGLSNP